MIDWLIWKILPTPPLIGYEVTGHQLIGQRCRLLDRFKGLTGHQLIEHLADFSIDWKDSPGANIEAGSKLSALHLQGGEVL